MRKVGCLFYYKAKGKQLCCSVILDKHFSLLSFQKCSLASHLTTQPHYRLCLGDVPFVAGKVSCLIPKLCAWQLQLLKWLWLGALLTPSGRIISFSLTASLSSKALLSIDNLLKWHFQTTCPLCAASQAVLVSAYSFKQKIHSWQQIKMLLLFKRSPLLPSRLLTMPFKRSLSYFSFQSTSPSHSVGANVQHVLHLMKQHTKALCNSRVVNDTPLAKPISAAHPASTNRKSSLPKESSSSQEELSEVLLTLQDEFGQMSL